MLSTSYIKKCKGEPSQKIVLSPWTKDVSWMYIQGSENVLCTFHLRLMSDGANMYVFERGGNRSKEQRMIAILLMLSGKIWVCMKSHPKEGLCKNFNDLQDHFELQTSSLNNKKDFNGHPLSVLNWNESLCTVWAPKLGLGKKSQRITHKESQNASVAKTYLVGFNHDAEPSSKKWQQKIKPS